MVIVVSGHVCLFFVFLFLCVCCLLFNQYLQANSLICFILQRKVKCTPGVQDMVENLVKDT